MSTGTMDMTGTANGDFGIELCVGLSIFDSMADLDGIAINSTVIAGTGPLTDADNSRWYARCCLLIPFGAWRAAGIITAVPWVMHFPSPRPYSHSVLTVHESGTANIMNWTWHCEVDSKAMRKLEGIETENIQLAFEAVANAAVDTGNAFTWGVDMMEGRHLLSKRG